VNKGKKADSVLDLPHSDQPRLVRLAEGLGDDGGLKALRLDDYAPRKRLRPVMLQQILFSYTDAI
jgi:hypothetical protein